MGEGTPGQGNPFVLEGPSPLGLHSTGLALAPAWLTTRMLTAMAQVAMSPMGPSPEVHLSGAHIAPPLAMARILPCWRPPRAARGMYGCVLQSLEWSSEQAELGDRPLLLAAFLSSWACCFPLSTNSQSPSPPSSSIAYSLLSASSEQDNPSTSGCRFVR